MRYDGVPSDVLLTWWHAEDRVVREYGYQIDNLVERLKGAIIAQSNAERARGELAGELAVRGAQFTEDWTPYFEDDTEEEDG